MTSIADLMKRSQNHWAGMGTFCQAYHPTRHFLRPFGLAGTSSKKNMRRRQPGNIRKLYDVNTVQPFLFFVWHTICVYEWLMDQDTNRLIAFNYCIICSTVAIQQLQRLFRSSCVIAVYNSKKTSSCRFASLPGKWKRVQLLVNLRRGSTLKTMLQTQTLANGLPGTGKNKKTCFDMSSLKSGRLEDFPFWGQRWKAEEFDVPCPGGQDLLALANYM